MNRRAFLSIAPLLPLAMLIGGAAPAGAQSSDIDIEAILDDPDAPVAGNPDGDVTIVAFFDYNCPFCKKTASDLKRFVSNDGKVRLVYKDWRILTKASVYGAQLALTAKYQDKYEAAHAALIGIHGQKLSEASVPIAVRAAGVDMTALQNDLNAHDADAGGLLRRNLRQAQTLGLQGTPVYLIGPYKVAAALDYDGFELAVANFRAQIAK